MTVIFVLISNQTYWESPQPRILQDQVACGIHSSKESIWASRRPLPSSSSIHLSKASPHNTINQSFLDLCSVHREMSPPTSRMCCKEMNLAKVHRPSNWKQQLHSSYKMRKCHTLEEEDSNLNFGLKSIHRNQIRHQDSSSSTNRKQSWPLRK